MKIDVKVCFLEQFDHVDTKCAIAYSQDNVNIAFTLVHSR